VPENEYLSRLKQKVERRELEVAVVGLGYVGLPLAVRFAELGFTVTGVDLDRTKVDALNRGESYIDDVPAAVVAECVAKGKLRATTDPSIYSRVDSISICVPTPLSKFRDPDLGAVIAVADAVTPHLRAGQLVVLESTTYPGTTEDVFLPRLKSRGLEPGRDCFLAFSPERVDPGRRDFMMKNTPRVVGGQTAACREAVAAVYGSAIDHVVPVSSPRAAEMAKLLENTFRSVNIALVNELAIMCDRLNIDVFEVIRAASSKPFGFMPFYPGPGLGGHCLPIDPLYLSWKMRSLDYRARFIEVADEINRSMPHYVVNKVFQGLNAMRKPVQGSKVLVLGVAYKRDVEDVRESPAFDVIKGLEKLGAVVSYHDPYVPSLEPEGVPLRSVPLDDAVLRGCDCALIITDHRKFDYGRIVRLAPLVVDTRNATENVRGEGRVVTL
jgi:UDP-N-acetyl-D-glucosamine dehydrogenase